MEIVKPLFDSIRNITLTTASYATFISSSSNYSHFFVPNCHGKKMMEFFLFIIIIQNSKIENFFCCFRTSYPDDDNDDDDE